MRVLLVNINQFGGLRCYPIGLDYLVSFLEGAGVEVDKLDLAISGSEEKISFFESKYDVVGFGIRNVYEEKYGGANYILGTIRTVKGVVDKMRKGNPKCKMVLGGSGYSLMPEAWQRWTGISNGVSGDGRRYLAELLGIKYKESNSFSRGSWGYMHQYLKAKTMGNIQSKRGCGFNCTYCSYPVIEGREYRLRDPVVVAREYKQLEMLGFEKIVFVDSVFNYPLDHTKEVLREMIRANTIRPWTGFFNPRAVDRELLELISESNMDGDLRLNIDSGSEEMLENLNKGFRVDEIRKVVALCKKNKRGVSLSLLFGGPGESRKTVRETMRLVSELNPNRLSVNYGVVLHPTTPLGKKTKGRLWKDEGDFRLQLFYPFDYRETKRRVDQELGFCRQKISDG